ncbi:MAG: hypothetical protein KatS3mg077_3293 [Candidatus Binatia bacterium]|nr:MAG: hypothetical protein KatS3mg077_3293 [Candidatus Binatia bacterium]
MFSAAALSKMSVAGRATVSARLTPLRWILVIATVYLVWFSQRPGATSWVVASYVVFYLASGFAVHLYLRRHEADRRFLMGLVVFDVASVSVGLVLAHRAQADFYPVVFLALFVAAVALDMVAAVVAATLLGLVHLAASAATLPGPIWEHSEELLRLPFLLAAAAFFGYLCQLQRRRARRRALLQRRRDRLRALATAAHDIRSPLANVVSLTEMLLAGDAGELNEDQRDLLERAHADMWRVMRRATNLMDAARLDSEALPLEFERADLAEIAAEVVQALRTAARIRKLHLVFENRAHSTEVLADRAQMERALSNLLDNAIKYSPAHATVRLVLENRTPGWVVAEVTDQGPGVPEPQQQLLFRPYARMHAGPPLAGSGLGLFIVRRIVEGHRGSVSLENSPLGGAVARVSLPLASSERPAPESSR